MVPGPWQRDPWRRRLERFADWRVKTWIKCAEFVRRTTRPGSFILATILVLYGLEQLAKSDGVPHGAWEKGAWGNDFLFVTGVVVLLGYFLITLAFAAFLKRADQDESLYGVCRDVARVFDRYSDIDHDQLGVHVWTVAGPPGARHLRRRATFLPEGREQSSIAWRMGKGAIGRCWQQKTTFVADIDGLVALATNQEEFEELDRDTRLGLSWEEFDEVRQYRAIWVAPIKPGGRFRGCLSVDVSLADKAGELGQVARDHGDALDAHLNVCVTVLK